MLRSIKTALCGLLALLTATAAGCTGTAPDATTAPAATTTVETEPVTLPVTTAPAGASTDSAFEGDSAVSYNELEIKKNINEIESAFDELLDTHHFAGSVYAKVGNDFEYIKTRGFANQGAHLDNSIYRSSYGGSLTKLFTATAVMKLAEEKKLSLNDTLDKYFAGCTYGKEVTIRQLLTMTSGIPNYVSRKSEMTPNAHLKGTLSGDDYEKNKATILSWILSQPLGKVKDGNFEFSDSNYYLLGEIIGSVSQMPYETYMSEHIFKPALMNKTGFEADDATTRPYDSTPEAATLLYEGVGYSALGVITNVSDLLKFIEAFTGGTLISETSVREMMTDNGTGYGCGAFVSGDCFSCIGEIDAYSAKLSFSTDKRKIFAAMSNYKDTDTNLIHRVFRNYLVKYSH